MKDVAAGLRAHLTQQVTSLSQCMSITRRDGKALHFTTHDRPLTVAGVVYTPVGSFRRSSISVSLALDVDTFDFQGALNTIQVTREDIAAGLYDWAEVKLMIVNWTAPDDGHVTMRKGWIGDITANENGSYSAEVRGMLQVLTFRIGEAYSPECRADLGDRRCKLSLEPKRWQPATTYAVGSTVLGVVDAASAFVNLSFENPSFEADNNNTFFTAPTGWTAYGEVISRWKTADDEDDLEAKVSPQFIAHVDVGASRSKQAVLSQKLDLIDQGLTDTDLDTGLCRLVYRVWASSMTDKAWHNTLVYALDASGNQIGLIYNPGGRHTANDLWVEYYATDILIPANTRFLRFDLVSEKSTSEVRGSAFDSIWAAVNQPGGTLENTTQFGGVMMRCTQAGTSGSSEPSFTNLIGQTIADNGVIWQVTDNYKGIGEVDTLLSSTEINVTGLTKEAGWYDGGLLRWETGKNAGRPQEVKLWANGRITFFQRPYYPPEAGDRFVIHPGCDKRRSTCAEKFANILNFRGEPDVPGQDEYYKTPNAPSTA